MSDSKKLSNPWNLQRSLIRVDFVQHQAEGATDQPQSITSTKNPRVQNQENADLLKSKASKITTTHSQKNVKNVTGRRKIKSPSKKGQPEIPPPPEENGNKVLF